MGHRRTIQHIKYAHSPFPGRPGTERNKAYKTTPRPRARNKSVLYLLYLPPVRLNNLPRPLSHREIEKSTLKREVGRHDTMNTTRYETRLQSRARARAIDINFGIYWLVRDLGTLEFYGLWFWVFCQEVELWLLGVIGMTNTRYPVGGQELRTGEAARRRFGYGDEETKRE